MRFTIGHGQFLSNIEELGLHIWGDTWGFNRFYGRWSIEGGGRSWIFFTTCEIHTASPNKFFSSVEQIWSSGVQIWGGAIWELISCDDRILVSLFKKSVLRSFADRRLCILAECLRVRCNEASAVVVIGYRIEGGGKSWTNSRRCEFHSLPFCKFLTCVEVMVSRISYLRGSDLRTHHESEWSVMENTGGARSRTNCRTREMHCGQFKLFNSAEWLCL